MNTDKEKRIRISGMNSSNNPAKCVMSVSQKVIVVILASCSLALPNTARAHREHYVSKETVSVANHTPAISEEDAVEMERQIAYHDFLMLMHLARHAPSPLQAEIIRVAGMYHTFFNRGPGAANAEELNSNRQAIQSAFQNQHLMIPLQWDEGLCQITSEPPAIALALGIPRHLLVQFSNHTNRDLTISAKQVGDDRAPATNYLVYAGKSQFLPLRVKSDSMTDPSMTLEFTSHGASSEQRLITLPVSVHEPAIIKGTLFDKEHEGPWPGRVFVLCSDGVYRRDAKLGSNESLSVKQLLQFTDHGSFYQLPFFYSEGTFEIKVPAGRTRVSLERGFEHEIAETEVDLKPGETREVALVSGRLVDMKSRGWVSGDTHIHWVTNQWNVDLPLELLATIQRAEDLRVANNLTLLHRRGNQAFINPSQAPMGPVQEFSDAEYHIEMGEEYRNQNLYGHLCFLNLDWLVMPIGTGPDIAGEDTLDYPINKLAILACREQGGISCEAHGLGANHEVPINVIHDLTDSLDQINPEDYYNFLECGFRLPLTNGSDHPARVVGCARAYVKVEGEFTYAKWIEGIRQCRTFTTSGPLLFLTVNDAQIGDTLDLEAEDTVTIKVEAVSRYPLGNLQIVSNSQVVKEARIDGTQGSLQVTIPVQESRWIVARCSSSNEFNAILGPGIAHTSAVYVNVAGEPRFQKSAAKLWISRMKQHIRDIHMKGRFANDSQRNEAIQYVVDGIEKYEQKIADTPAALDSLAQQAAQSERGSPAKIVLIPTELDHPWATHMYRKGCELLAACLNQNPGVQAVVSPDFDWPSDPKVLADVDAIVFYSRPAADIVLDPARRKQFEELLRSGVGFTAIHWATGTSHDKYGPDFLGLLGGWFSMSHAGLKIDKQTLQQVAPTHPICNGWEPFDLRDEFYLNLKFETDAQPMFLVNVDGQEQTVGWVLERPNSNGGRSFGTTLAHFHDNFAIPAFRRAIVNGILWTAHVEVPAKGAQVELQEADLQLPPDPGEPTKDVWPMVSQVDAQPLNVQVARLVEALDYIGNPLPEETKKRLQALKKETDTDRVGKEIQSLLDPLCLAAVTIGENRLTAHAMSDPKRLVEKGWSNYLVKVCNTSGITSRLSVESPNARSMPHSKAEDVASRWLGLSMFDGRPMRPDLSGLELEYRIIQLYSRDAGIQNASLDFSVATKPGQKGRQIREWRFDKGTDGWNAANQVNLSAREGSLFVQGTGSDPFITAEVGSVTGEVILRFWSETDQDGVGQVFWWTEERPEPDGERVISFPIIPGGAHQYEVVLPVEGVLAGVRIDPNLKPCETRFDWIDLSYAHRQGETWNSVPLRFQVEPAIPVRLIIKDKKGEPAVAALEIRDSLGRVYPEQSKRLAPDFFFHPQIYRRDGEDLLLPPGEYMIRCWRGPHSIPENKKLVVGKEPTTLEYQVRRWIDPTTFGWWSGDHHIHAAGCLHYVNPTQGVLPKDMLRQTMGEDMNVGCCLTWGPCFDYQKQFFTGDVDQVSEYPYLLRYDIEVSGFGSHVSGHLNLLRLKEQIYPGGNSKDHWPTLGLNTLKWAKRQGAICGPAHSGHGLTNYVDRLEDCQDGPHGLPHYNIPAFDGIGANEYIVDVTHEVPGPEGLPIPAIDFIATMNTPRQDEWNMWYHTLNCGFRVRASGETDFPCMSGERVGIGRVYVHVPDRLNFSDWVQGIQDGRSYVSDGSAHLLDFEARPVGETNYLAVGTMGSEIQVQEPTMIQCRAKCAALLDRVPATNAGQGPLTVELIVNGYPVANAEIPAGGSLEEVQLEAKVNKSSWLALRIFPHVHTNPIFVLIDGQPIRASRKSAEWCLRGVEQCWREKQRSYNPDEQEDALQAYQHAREVYKKILSECQE